MAKERIKALKELLTENTFQNVNVKIGSKQGSSFWYCGSGNSNISIPAIRKIRQTMLNQNKRIVLSLRFRLKHLDRLYEEVIQERIKKHGEEDIENYKKRLYRKKENERKSLPKRIKLVEYDIATPLLDRPVLEVLMGISPDERPCKIIYVQGTEKGAYWTIKEYEKRHKEN